LFVSVLAAGVERAGVVVVKMRAVKRRLERRPEGIGSGRRRRRRT